MLVDGVVVVELFVRGCRVVVGFGHVENPRSDVRIESRESRMGFDLTLYAVTLSCLQVKGRALRLFKWPLKVRAEASAVNP